MNKLESIKQLRKRLHQIPELAGNEFETANEIISFLKKTKPDYLYTNIAGTGIIAVYDTKKSGLNVLFRAELDALPIEEKNTFSYKSKRMGASHTCGHDGHMTILLGVADRLNAIKDNLCGKIILLFQPAEENAVGAKQVLKQPIITDLKIDYVFALHNLPGFKKGSIIIKKDVFAATSKGLIVRLYGKSSHAGHPERGISPISAMIEIINGLNELSKDFSTKNEKTMITIIHVNLGKISFGTLPGNGVVMATFRSTDEGVMQSMSKRALEFIEKITSKYNLSQKIEWTENFPLLINDDECIDLVKHAAEKKGMNVIIPKKPFSWTEDFSYFTQRFSGAFFGIGSGESHPQLHNPDYDFPDEIITNGIDSFIGIIEELSDKKHNHGE